MKYILVLILLISSFSVSAKHATYLELLRLSPSVQEFEDDAGNVKMTELYLREVVDDMHDAGVDTIVIMYVEYFGFWFFPRNSYDFDYDTGTAGQYWHTKLSDPRVENFDPLDVILSQAEVNGQHVFIGLGRNGDTSLIEDLLTEYNGASVPLKYGLTVNQRVDVAVSRTQQVAYEISVAYGGYSSFSGWYLSHEISHLESGNSYLSKVTQNGVIPLRSYGKPILISPADTADISSFTAGNSILVSGVDIVAPQDAVGAGTDFVNNVYTFNQNIPISQINAVFTNWKNAVTVANNWLANNGNPRPQIKLWSNTEMWEMDGPLYEKDYPTKIRRVVKQLEQYSNIVEKHSFNAWFGMVDSGATSLSPVQNHHGRTDVKDRAEGLFYFLKNEALQ